MFVCVCHAVTEDDIDLAYHDGAETVEDVMVRTRAGSSCGTCHETIDAVLADCYATCPAFALRSA